MKFDDLFISLSDRTEADGVGDVECRSIVGIQTTGRLLTLSLLQVRHGPLHVQKIPATHKGDYGIDITAPRTALPISATQSKSRLMLPQEPIVRRKRLLKTSGSLPLIMLKLESCFWVNIKHWILVAPLHDSKDFNVHCAKKTKDLRASGCAALDPQFEVSIQDLSIFPHGAIATGMSALSKVTLSIPSPSPSELDSWAAGSSDLLANATHKLKKRAAPDQLEEVVAEAVRSFLQGNAALDALRSSSPELYEKVISAIKSRSRRLQFVGPQLSGSAGQILSEELEALIGAMQSAAPALSAENAEQIAYGAICEWIMRCPLDFPSVQ